MEVLAQMGLNVWQSIALAVVGIVLAVMGGLVVWAMSADDWGDVDDEGYTQPLQDAIQDALSDDR